MTYWLCLLLLGTLFLACRPQQPSPVSEPTPALPHTTPLPPSELLEPVSTATPTPSAVTTTPAETASAPPPDILRGVGLIGASTLDEYRGTDNRGGRYASVTYNMAELLVLLRGFNLGAWGDWGEPRRTGYEYNWARSGATSSSMISQGQHTGLAEQVASGEVTFVFILIGANDFGPHIGSSYADIYEGRMSDAQLQEKVEAAIANVTLATDTILEAGVLGMGVSLFPHWHLDLATLEQFPDAARRQRVEDAIAAINEGIRAMAAERDIFIVDPAVFVLDLLPQLDENGKIEVGGVLIDFINRGNSPYHARLDDQSGHTGTILSGLMANHYFIEPLNHFYNAGIAPLRPEELLKAAGIHPDQE
jgi:hypothetical protein